MGCSRSHIDILLVEAKLALKIAAPLSLDVIDIQTTAHRPAPPDYIKRVHRTLLCLRS